MCHIPVTEEGPTTKEEDNDAFPAPKGLYRTIEFVCIWTLKIRIDIEMQ